MNDKELYQKKMQAQLDELQAEVEKLRAKAAQDKAEEQHEMNKHLKALDTKIEEGKAKLSELLTANGKAWDSAKDGMESTWHSLKAGIGDVISKYK